MSAEERRLLIAVARYLVACREYDHMGGVYIYAVADERTAASHELTAAYAEIRL